MTPFTGDPGVEYRPVPNRPGYYAGRDGSIWSHFRGRSLKRKLSLLPNQRLYVTFATPPLTMQVSRLIAEAFHGPCPDGLECCHGPGGRQDNRPENLRWGTHELNVDDLHRFDEMRETRGEGNVNAVLTTAAVLRMVELRGAGVSQQAIADELRVSRQCISRVFLGLTWSHVTGIPKRVATSRIRTPSAS